MQNKHFNSTFDISTDVLTEIDDTNYNRTVVSDESGQKENEIFNIDDEDNEQSSFVRKGTFKINKTTQQHKPNINKSAIKETISVSQTSQQETQKKLRDLSINIK
jgi:hypothetical protein